MLVLGLSGGVDAIYENRFEFADEFAHDAAAVLVHDGRVVAAVEEERLNRIKHTNKSPASAIRFCLESCGVELEDLDRVVFYATPEYLEAFLRLYSVADPMADVSRTPRDLVNHIFLLEFGREVDPERIHFIHHHMAHAVTAYHLSGFEEALVMTFDSEGDGLSGMVLSGRDGELELLRSFPDYNSLGKLYWEVTRFLGYRMFDEYKVMGLAPYGDRDRFREHFRTFYELQEEGNYKVNLDRVGSLHEITSPRRQSEPFGQLHKDLAAALQEALETIVFHVLEHFRTTTGHRYLALAGGVAHNCTLTGKLYYSGMFDAVFVQPAAHDAGCALGAALSCSLPARPERQAHVFWGTPIGDRAELSSVLEPWSELLQVELMNEPEARAAQLLADGAVIGWVQGRSEFGPRALGNRSILADPRPPENKDIINMMIKQREAYRPFAPSVLEEHAADYFHLPTNETDFSFMNFVVDVRPEKQATLGATTHVDGSSRIQTVSREANPRYWRLIEEFRKLTGVPVLLNTSFNNDVEPIVDSVEDSIAAFLTTDLHYLVVGDYLVSKRQPDIEAYARQPVALPPAVELRQFDRFVSRERTETTYEIGFNWRAGRRRQISSQTYALLKRANGARSIGELIEDADGESRRKVIDEVRKLWSRRLVKIGPGNHHVRLPSASAADG